MAQASSLDVLVLVGEVGMQAGLHSNATLLLKNHTSNSEGDQTLMLGAPPAAHTQSLSAARRSAL